MSIVAWLLIGLCAAAIASRILNRGDEGGALDIVLGAGGAVIGGCLFSVLRATGSADFDPLSVLVAVIGAVLVLVIYHAPFGRRLP